MVTNIRHTGIVVYDLNKSLNFYIKKLGFEISNRMNESGVFIDKVLGLNNVFVTTVKMTLGEGQMIELLDYSSHKKELEEKYINDIGPTHMAFTVEDLDSIYTEFLNDGIEFISKPELSSDGNVKVAFCRAPEGTFIELVQLIE